MGTHARPRRRVRAAALGTLAVGATLTGVGLTAAALDPSGAGLADGTLGTDPVNFAASGLGAPVPVADVSSLDGSSLGQSLLVTKSAPSGDAVLSAPSAGNGGSGGYGPYVTSGKAAGAQAVNQAASATTSGAAPAKQIKSTVTAPRGNAASAPPSSTGSGADAVSADGTAPKTSAVSGTTGLSNWSGHSSGASTKPTGQLPSLDASLPISTALPLPSLPSIPGLPSISSLPSISNLSTTVNHAKSTVAGLLDEVAGLV